MLKMNYVWIPTVETAGVKHIPYIAWNAQRYTEGPTKVETN
jgi:hypothetical protein